MQERIVKMNKPIFIKGMRLDTVDTKKVFDAINKEIKNNTRQYISITNTEAMYIGSEEDSHFEYINNSYLSLCDGTGLVIAAKSHGLHVRKYHGPDFFEDVLREGEPLGWTHYFLGGKEGIAEKLTSKFIQKYPKLKIVGNYSPPFRELTKDEEIKMISKINDVKPNFVWVSLGLPKQERWISKYIDKLNVNFLVGVGAAFDFHTDAVRRAPIFYQKIGMEWLYRTFFERRLVVRQVRGFKFMFKAILNNKK